MSVTAKRTLGNLQLLVVDADPSGGDTAPQGSLALDEANVKLYQNTDGVTAWNELATVGGLDVPQEQIYHVGKHGNDADNGKTPNTAFLTFGAAITAAQAQVPSATNRFSIVCKDSGIYVENVDLLQFIDIDAPNATIQSVGAVIALQLRNDSTVRLREVIQDTGGPSAVNRTGSAGTSYVHIDRITLGATGFSIGINNFSPTESSVLVAKVGTITVGNGKGVAVNNAGHIHIDIEDIYLTQDNAIGVERGFVGSTIGRVTHILELGTPANTTAINVTAGLVSLQIDSIQADTVWSVGASGQLDLFHGSQVTGATVETGTVNTTEVGSGGGPHPVAATGTSSAAWEINTDGTTALEESILRWTGGDGAVKLQQELRQRNADKALELVFFEDGSPIDGTVILPEDGVIRPDVTEKWELGTDTYKFKRVRAQEVKTGDLVLEGSENGARWRIVEEPDRIVVTNEVTGDRFRLVLEPI